ncbi:MAG: MmcQ/YjbR family DNA-binding protein [Flavobacteriaceae bacterium]|nr:MmcQ/YjbR family DNA-binding protein [Flavobacteriaceae bacterium]
MNIEQFRNYCLTKKGVTECFPFDDKILVFKVLHKMFALTSLVSDEFSVNLKCNPEKAIELREQYENITAGYHMSKKHWNTVLVNQRISNVLFIELINHSYDLVIAKMTKKDRALLSIQ